MPATVMITEDQEQYQQLKQRQPQTRLHGGFHRQQTSSTPYRSTLLRLLPNPTTQNLPPDPERVELANALAEFVGDTLRWASARRNILEKIFPADKQTNSELDTLFADHSAEVSIVLQSEPDPEDDSW